MVDERFTEITRRESIMKGDRAPGIVAVGGGKGGVGKSFIAVGLATAFAMQGRQTVIVDLDLGGANLHTFFGIRQVSTGVGDFIYRPHSKELIDYSVETNVPNLRLVPGSGFIPGIANIYHFQKLKILRALRRMKAELVVLDLGAGTSYNVIDFFSITRSGILVTNPEPSAVLNAYEFLKNVLYRLLTRQFKKEPSIIDQIRQYKVSGNQGEKPTIEALTNQIRSLDPEAALKIQRICRGFCPGLVLNMTKGDVTGLVENLSRICRDFLSMDIQFLGAVPRDELVQRCLLHMENCFLKHPDSPVSMAIKDVSERCLEGMEFLSMSSIEIDQCLGQDETIEKYEPQQSLNKAAELTSLLACFFREFSEGKGKQINDSPDAYLTMDEALSFEFRLDDSLVIPRFSDVVEARQGESRASAPALRQVLDRIVSIADAESAALAIENTKERVKQTRQVAWAWIQCGIRLLSYNQQKASFRAFSRAYALYPDDQDIANNYGASLIAMGQAARALEKLKKALKTDRPKASLLFNYGLAAFLQEKYPDALWAFDNMKVHGLLDHKAALIAAGACYRLAQTEKSKDYLAIAQEKGGSLDQNFWFNMGIVLLGLERYQEACETLTRAIDTAELDHEALAARGLCHWHLGDRDKALDDLSTAIHIKPSRLGYRAARGSAFFQAGILDKAIEDIEMISTLRPENQRYQALLQAIRVNLGVRQEI